MLSLIQNILFTILPWLFVLTVVVVVHEMGHFLVAKACGVAIDRFSIGFGKTLFAWRDKSGVEWRLAALPLGGYVRFAGDVDASSSVPDSEDLADLKQQIVDKYGREAVSRFFHFKPLWQRALVVVAGPVANFILAIVIFATLLATLGQPFGTPRIDRVLPDSAAARAGFQPNDLIVQMNSRPVDNYVTVQTYVANHPGVVIPFVVRRGAVQVALTATPDAKPVDALFGKSARKGVLGVGHLWKDGEARSRTLNPIAAIGEGTKETVDTLGATLSYVGRLVVGKESADKLGGPIRTALMSKAVAESGASDGKTIEQHASGMMINLIAFSALISISIGFMNLLPIPMLDGGHLLFYGYEAVARRPVTAKVQAVSYRVGLALVVGLLLFATWNDLQLPVLKILGGHVS